MQKGPDKGTPLTYRDDQLEVPNDPIIPFIEGDGVGKDITKAMRKVLSAAVKKAYGESRELIWWEIFAGQKSFEKFGEWLPEETLRSIEHFHIAIKGPLGTPVGEGMRSLNVTMRGALCLFACVRPVRYINGVPSPLTKPEDVDLVIFRENSEDLYAGIEWQYGSRECTKILEFLSSEMGVTLPCEESSIGIKPISSFASKRIMRKVLDYAIKNGRKSVTIVHKGNIMKFTEGDFRRYCYEVAQDEYREYCVTEKEVQSGALSEGKILVNDRIADNMFQQLILQPGNYDLLVLPNLNGDYVSDAAAAIVGGLGIAPGVNMNDKCALFEATHGTAPDLEGDKANPTSIILSGVMLLQHLGWSEAANLISKAVSDVIGSGCATEDIAKQIPGAKSVSCSAFTEALCERL